MSSIGQPLLLSLHDHFIFEVFFLLKHNSAMNLYDFLWPVTRMRLVTTQIMFRKEMFLY